MGTDLTDAQSRACRNVDVIHDWIGGECIAADAVPAHVVREARYETPISDLTTPELLAVMFDGSREQAYAAVLEMRDRYLAANADYVARLAAEPDDEDAYEFTAQDAKTLRADAWRAEQKDMRAAGGM